MIALHLRDAFIALHSQSVTGYILFHALNSCVCCERVSGCIGRAYRSRCAQWHPCTRWWFGSFFFEIDLHGALPYWPSPPFHWLYIKLPRSPLPHRLTAAGYAYRFPSCDRPVFSAVFTSTVLPALALVTELQAGTTCSHSTRLARFSFLRTDSRTIADQQRLFCPAS